MHGEGDYVSWLLFFIRWTWEKLIDITDFLSASVSFIDSPADIETTKPNLTYRHYSITVSNVIDQLNNQMHYYQSSLASNATL